MANFESLFRDNYAETYLFSLAHCFNWWRNGLD